jgi:hypothetical protein
MTLEDRFDELRTSLAGMELEMRVAREGRRELITMVAGLDTEIKKLIGLVAGMSATVALHSDHIADHCMDLDTLRIAKAEMKGTIRGASMISGLVAALVGTTVTAGWAVASKFGWLG